MHTPMSEVIEPLVTLIREHLQNEVDCPVRPVLSPEQMRVQIDLDIHDDGLPLDDVVQLLRQVFAATPTTASSSFYNQLFAGRDGAAVLGDALVSLLNNSMYTYKIGGVQVLIEMALLEQMGQMMGMSNSEGMFTPGGSLSNFCAVMVARNEVVPDAHDNGLYGKRLRIYSSTAGHYSIRKAATMSGIGRDNVVRVAVDDRGRMVPEALETAIQADLDAGYLPTMINATTGTTVLGAFDPLDAIADIAAKYGIWMHTDAAFGGSMRFHPDFIEHFKGIERSDSITWDAHKIMGVPLICSAFIVRKQGLLTKHFDEKATYLFQDDADRFNPGTRSIQCGRRNDALKLWSAWKKHGNNGYKARVVRLRHLTLIARDIVVAHPELKLAVEPESLTLNFTVNGVKSDELCALLNENQRLMVGHALVHGQLVVRAVFVNPEITEANIQGFFEACLSP